MSSRKDWYLIAIIFVAGFLLRSSYFGDYSLTVIYPVQEYSDASCYLSWAKDIAYGDILGRNAFMKWPFYAYYLAFLLKIFAMNIGLVYIFQSLLGILNCILIYFIGKIIFNRLTGFVAAMFCVFYSPFIFYDGILIYTNLSLFLNSLLLLFILKNKDNLTKKRLFWLGLFLGICTLTQGNILVFGLFAILWLLKRKKLRPKAIFFNFLFFLFGLGIVIIPVTLRNYFLEKDFVFISGNLGINFYLGNNPQGKGRFYCPSNITENQRDMFRDAKIVAEASSKRKLKTSEVSSFWFKKTLDAYQARAYKIPILFLKKINYIFSPHEAHHDIEYHFIKEKIGIFRFSFLDLRFLMPLAFLGMIFGLRKFKEAVLLYIFISTLILTIIIFFVTTRYRIIIVPALAIFAGYAVFKITGFIKNKNYLKTALSFLLLILLAAFFNRDLVFKKIKNLQHNANELMGYCLLNIQINETKGNYQAALNESVSLEKISPYDPRLKFRSGIIYFYQNNFRLAEEKFKQVIQLNPLQVDAYYNLGFIYNKEFRYKEAVEVLEKAVSLDEECARAHFELAFAYKELGEYKKAEEQFLLAKKYTNLWRKIDREIIKKELTSLKKNIK